MKVPCLFCACTFLFIYRVMAHSSLTKKMHSRVSVMSKPMGSECILISRLLLLNFLFLWQLGTGAASDYSTKAAADTWDTTKAGNITDDEAKDLQDLIYWLRITPVPLNLSCSNEEDAQIKCSCDNSSEACSITTINFRNKMLDGYIPSSAGKFKNLEVLDLSNNRLYGGIPSTLGNLQRLEKLDLSYNKLTGPIPENMSTLQSLTELNLFGNKLAGIIPKNLTGLQSLNYLDLADNQLSGPIPNSIGDCKKLFYIHLRFNILNGTIPKSLGNLSSLIVLSLYSNSLSDKIPPELGKLSALRYLSLDDNNLEGNLPEELGKLVDLRVLSLTSNKFNGSIPDTYAKLIKLQYFEVGGNYLSGPIPDYFGEWVDLIRLNLVGNNFVGNLPAATFNLSQLEELLVSDVSNPGISFPEKKVKPESLKKVVLRNCSIHGSIPEYIGKWPYLIYLDLSFNNLTGAIPESLQKLNKLFLTNNSLATLPSWITSKSNRTFYPKTDLSYNNFNVSCENITCLGLENVNIHPTRSFIANMQNEKCRHGKHNSLFINSGGEEVKAGKRHYYKDTSTARFSLSQSEDWAYSFSGDYYWTKINDSTLVRNLTCVVSSPEAKLENNYRLAPISLTYYGLCLRNGEYSVTLHFAETLYSKGEDNSKGKRDFWKGKRVFDVYIQKEIKWKDLNIKELLGELQDEGKKLTSQVKIHDGSLEIHFYWAGKGSIYNPPHVNGPLISAISVTRVHRDLKRPKIAVITVSCVLFLLLLFAIMWRMGWIGDRELRETKVKIGERTFSLKQIIDATKKFSPKTELGRGRSGIVYKAELPDLTVAVKKLFSKAKAVDEIASEVYAKKALEHENLVKLLASHSRNHLHLLIYEYMELGSLKQVLFGANSKVQLDWPKRFTICRGIAKGLKYLHERNPQIIHRNMKASNVLLDESCNSKISDFGLAKFYEDEDDTAEGDLLYMAPEYATRRKTRRKMTVKVDVYSFGILLLEIVSGRNNAEYRPNQETVFLLDTAGNLHARNKLAELVDTRLDSYDWDQANIVLNLAIKCTDQSPSLRPTMSQVMTVLEGEKTLEDVSKEITTST